MSYKKNTLNNSTEPSQLHELIESSKARNKELTEHIRGVHEESLKLESEEDPTSLRQIINSVNEKVQELERQVEMSQAADKIRDQRKTLFRETLDEQDRQERYQLSRSTLLNSW